MMTQEFRLAGIAALLFAATFWGVSVAQEEGHHDDDKAHHQSKEIAWFDMEHCEICKNMASMKDQMHKIKWEIHMLENGMVSIAIVPEDMKEEMAKAEQGVMQTVSKLEQGEQLHMCGYCNSYGKLMSMGAKFQKIKSLGVDLSIVTSDDAEVVKEIQAMGKKAKVEHEKMLKRAKDEHASHEK